MLGEGRARLSPALAAGNGSTWLSRRAPGHVGKAAQRVQPGARVQNPQPFPTGAPGHALGSPAAGAYVSGSGAFRRPHPQVPAGERRLRSGGGGGGGLQQVPRAPLAPGLAGAPPRPAPFQTRPVPGSVWQARGAAGPPLRKPARWSPKPTHKSFMSRGGVSRVGD